MPDRRADLYSRERIVSLEARYRHAVTRLTTALAIVSATLVATSIVLVRLAHESSQQSKQLTRVVRDAQDGRKRNVRVICDTINDNVRSINGVVEYIADQVVDGVVQTKSYSPEAVAALGAEPYKVRLRQSRRIAAQLRSFKHGPVDCELLAERVKAPHGA